MVRSFLSRIRPWHELALWMLVMLQTSWLVPWYFLLVPEASTVSPWVVFLILWLLVMIANTSMRILYDLRLAIYWRQALMILLLVIVEITSLKGLLYSHESITIFELLNRPLQSFANWREFIPLDFIILILVLIAFWRGIELSQGPIDSVLVRNEFRFGIVMCLVFILLDFNITKVNIRFFVYSFIFCGLVAMSSARIAVLESLRGGRRYSMDWLWATGIVILAAGLIGVSGLAVFVLSSTFPLFAKLVTLPVIVLAVLLTLLSIPVLYLVIWILSQTSNPTGLLDLLYQILERLNSLAVGLFEGLRKFIEKIPVNPLFQRMLPYVKPVMLWSLLFLGLIFLGLWVAFESWQERERRRMTEERLSLEMDPFLHGWQNALKKGLNKIISLLADNSLLHRRRRHLAAARIRQIYADLMDISERLGHPRPEGSTPLEFMPVLKNTFPSLDQEIELITTRYLSVRYGQFSETFWDLETVEQAWTKLFIQAKRHLEAARQPKR